MSKVTTSKHATWSVEVVAKDDPPSEKVRRRREQYRAYQQRRRAKERLRLEKLQHEVHALAVETQDLQARNLHLFASRGTDTGAPASLVAEFYKVYAHGHSTTHYPRQNTFLKAMMAHNVQGPDYKGVDALVEQWRLYGSLFATASYVPQRTTVRTIDETTLVIVDVIMTLRPTRGGVQCLLPGCADNEDLVQRLVLQPIIAMGSVRFVFDATGKVTWFGADMDFVEAFTGFTGSIQNAAEWLDHSTFSLSTGRVLTDGYEEPLTNFKPLPTSARHEIAFLLS